MVSETSNRTGTGKYNQAPVRRGWQNLLSYTLFFSIVTMISAQPAEKPLKPEFRHDINGLRAWAVLAVVFYHFELGQITGGFIGVDVFFVISGFLMAGIVISQLERGQFSLTSFYLARAKRIIPALLGLITATLTIGWFLLMPTDYQALGRHARESALFTSNLAYLAEFGYFDASAAEKWLLHTWSLAVEWQFYLVYPLALLLVARISTGYRFLLAIHGVAFTLSLAYAEFTTRTDPNAAFFLLASRAWELLLGSIAFLVARTCQPKSSLARTLVWLGMALIIVSAVLLDKDSRWPGLPALPPVLGAAMVLLAARPSSPWTNHPLLQWVGLRSYSIYLWHWLIVATLNYFYLHSSLLWASLGILASLLAGHLSFALIETPTRRILAGWRPGKSAFALAVSIVIVAICGQLVRASGFPSRLPDSVAPLEAQRHDKNPRQKECLNSRASCVFGGPEIDAIVIGDSHVDSVVTAIAAANPNPKGGVLMRAESGCLITLGATWHGKGDYKSCESLLEALRDELSTQHPGTPLIIVNRLALYLKGNDGIVDDRQDAPLIHFEARHAKPTAEFIGQFQRRYVETICEFAAKRPVYLVTPIPEMTEKVPRAMSRNVLRGRPADITLDHSAYLSRNAEALDAQNMAAERCGVVVLETAQHLCANGKCYGSKNGVALYTDDNHLSEQGNKVLVPMFREIFEKHQQGE